MSKKKILFLTSTRADYGKLKILMKSVEQEENFELYIFVTGMHMLSRYGSTYREVEKDNYKNIYKYINQKSRYSEQMDLILSDTISGLSNYVAELNPDLIVVHGDRLEALAGAIVGAFNNIKILHIEGGEVSGTIDESIRHAITKFSHIHLVANEEAKHRIIQMGESEKNVFIFGSPDIDIMYSDLLPELEEVKKRYDINFDKYAIVLYHPVTTDIKNTREKAKSVVDALEESDLNYVVIYPNNDLGCEEIFKEYDRLKNNSKIKFYPSMRFEYFLTLLKNSMFIIGNSSSGIREACVYGVPTIDLGERQCGRYGNIESILHANESKSEILNAIVKVKDIKFKPMSHYGNGDSREIFMNILSNDSIWDKNVQKKFYDLNQKEE